MQHATLRHSAPFAALLLALSLSASVEATSDWPQWRGERRDGKSTETGLLQEWPESGPPLAWESAGLGAGFSSLSIGGGRVFTLGDLDDGQYVFAMSESSGERLWQRRVGPVQSENYPGSRSTPTIDGDRIYVLNTEGELHCLRAVSGQQLWSRSLPDDFGGYVMMARAGINWTFAESPLVDGDRVVVTAGSPDATIVALDKMTGREIWRSQTPELGSRGSDGAAYSSIVISNGAGVRQYVQLMGRGVIGVRAEDGEFLWGYNRIANDVANIATPIVSEDFVFTTTGYQTGAALLRLVRNGDGVNAEEVYFLEPNVLQNHHGGLILHGGYIYTGTGHNKGFPISARLETGEIAWGPQRNAGRDSAAIAYADGHLYLRYQNGVMLLVEATPEAYREKGSFTIPGVEQPSWPHPVISGGKLYLREQDRLYCYDVRAET